MNIKNISNSIKYKLLVLICILFFIWYVCSSVLVFVNCLILDENNISVHKNVLSGNLIEVQLIEDSNFIQVVSTGELLEVGNVEEYVRVSAETKSYYNYDDNILVLPLSELEKRKIILQFAFLDLVLIIIYLGLSFIYHNWNFIKKLIFGFTLCVYLVVSYIVWVESLNTLFHTKRYTFIICAGKVLLFLVIAFSKAVKEYKQAYKKEI